MPQGPAAPRAPPAPRCPDGSAATTAAATPAAVQPADCSAHPTSTPNNSTGVVLVDPGGAPLRSAPHADCGDNIRQSVGGGTKIYAWCVWVSSPGDDWMYGRVAGQSDSQAAWVYMGDVEEQAGGTFNLC